MTHVFSEAAVQAFERTYQSDVRPVSGESSRGGCMRAVYFGLGALYGEDFTFRGSFHKSFFRRARKREIARNLPEGRLNTIDRVFRALSKEGILFAEQKFRLVRGGFRDANGTVFNSLEDVLIPQIINEPHGWHFFGAAVSGGIHSIILAIHKTTNAINIYWMDQFSDGFDTARPRAFASPPDVSGRLDQIVLRLGRNPMRIWQFNPVGALANGIEIDSDGDGLPDMTVPAAVIASAGAELNELSI